MSQRIRTTPILFAILAALGCAHGSGIDHSGADLGEQFFDALNPSGKWQYVADYGWCWQPDPAVVGSDFRPYVTGGHWIYTPDSWEFESNWPLGWATFHYGRWYADTVFGWLWVPDDVWSPAQVNWRLGGGYVGWIPSPPPGTDITTNDPTWFFVELPFFVSPDFIGHSIPLERWRSIFGVAESIPLAEAVHGIWTGGPDPHDFDRAGITIDVQPGVGGIRDAAGGHHWGPSTPFSRRLPAAPADPPHAVPRGPQPARSGQ